MKESTHTWHFLVEDLLLTNLENMNIQSPAFKNEQRYYQLTVFVKTNECFPVLLSMEADRHRYFELYWYTGITIVLQRWVKMKFEEASLCLEYTRFYMIEET